MQDSELIQAFLTESVEMLDDAEPKLIELQTLADSTGTADIETVNTVFRAFHSIKGSAGFLQMKNVSAVTHEAETLLDRFRKGKSKPTPQYMDVLLRAVDLIRKLLASVEETNSDEGSQDEISAIVRELAEAITREKDAESTGDAAHPAAPSSPPPPPPTPATASVLTESQKADLLITEDESVAASPAEPLPEPSTATAALVITPEMIAVYVQDAEELIEAAEQSVLKVEKAPDQARGLLREAMRALHTIKGNSGLMSFNDIERLSHKLETLFQCVSDGTVPADANVTKFALKVFDLFGKTVASIAKGGNGKIMGFSGFADLLDEMIPADVRSRATVSKATPILATAPPYSPAPAPAKPSSEKAEEKTEKTAARSETDGGTAMASRSIRVNVEKLDHLTNLVGELVIAEAMVTHNTDIQGLRLDNFDRAAHQLRLITTEIQDISMALRMIPLDATLKKMIRLVHDLSIKAGKKVELQLAGTETEVDRTVAELISDPLVHMVRNSVDHGIEMPEDRRQAGKSETGNLHIEARHQADEVLILISDDGRGLNRDKILKKGIERGLLKAGDPCSDEDIYELIFEAGFSTADKITDVSGRGVGMDVVRKNIEKIRGRVEIRTEAGIGTTFTIHIPLTLAIIQGMMVRVGHERFIIPLRSIRESLRPQTCDCNAIVGRGETITIRGDLLPLFRLARLFDTQGATEKLEEGIVVVIQEGNTSAALMVDELLGQQQTVVKSLGDTFGQIDGVSGASILSDGRVGLILDVAGILKLAWS